MTADGPGQACVVRSRRYVRTRDLETTAIYADYTPGAHEVDLVNDAFSSNNSSTNLIPAQTNSNQEEPVNLGASPLSEPRGLTAQTSPSERFRIPPARLSMGVAQFQSTEPARSGQISTGATDAVWSTFPPA
jgi:hypothetical protein